MKNRIRMKNKQETYFIVTKMNQVIGA